MKMFVMPICDCVSDAYDEEVKRKEAMERQNLLAGRYEHTGLGERYRHATLENFEQYAGNTDAYNATKQFISALDRNIIAGRGLLFTGPVGTGKSHLIAALVNTALRWGHTTIVERVPKLLLAVRATYNNNGNEFRIMRSLAAADLLVLDDAGSEKKSQWSEPTLYTIIDERYNNNKSLCITTNLTLDQLQQKVGPRAMDRILEMCQIVKTSGPSYRREVAKNRLRGGEV